VEQSEGLRYGASRKRREERKERGENVKGRLERELGECGLG
jgi:hypothetical protein